MISRLQTLALVALSLCISAALLALVGEPVSGKLLTVIGTTSGAVYAATLVFNKWWWKWPPLQGRFVYKPCLFGDWDVRIESLYVQNGERAQPIEAIATIVQDYGAVHLAFQSPESTGELLHGGIVRQPDDTYRLSGVYQNTPILKRQQVGNMPHRGAFWLTIVGNPKAPTEMRGPYWTDRGTSGELVFRRKTSP